jgi:hypothetical protein
MNFKNILNEINLIQIGNFYSMDTFIDKGTSILPRNKRGLYWIWTNYDFEDLKSAINNHNSEVPISKLIDQRQGLNSVCQVEHNGFKVVYNGIGGYKTNPKGFGLRERILQELNSNDYRTGTLNIRNRYENNINWAVSFFDFDDEENKKLLSFLNETEAYLNYASDLEKLWRLEFGHPILCRH